MLSKVRWVVPTAFTLLLGMGAGILHSPLLAVGALLSLVATGVAIVLDFTTRSRYDLGALRELHEREEVARLDPDSLQGTGDSFLCLYCNEVYSSDFRACPKCGKSSL